MTETALQALYKALASRLRNPSEEWGMNGWASLRKSKKPDEPVVYPYVIWFWAGGGATSRILGSEATLRLGVKCISNKLADAMRGAGRLSTLLDEHGERDNSTDYLDGGAEWLIISVTEEETIYIVEGSPDTNPVYHCGAFYRVVMEAL